MGYKSSDFFMKYCPADFITRGPAKINKRLWRKEVFPSKQRVELYHELVTKIKMCTNTDGFTNQVVFQLFY